VSEEFGAILRSAVSGPIRSSWRRPGISCPARHWTRAAATRRRRASTTSPRACRPDAHRPAARRRLGRRVPRLRRGRLHPRRRTTRRRWRHRRLRQWGDHRLHARRSQPDPWRNTPSTPCGDRAGTAQDRHRTPSSGDTEATHESARKVTATHFPSRCPPPGGTLRSSPAHVIGCSTSSRSSGSFTNNRLLPFLGSGIEGSHWPIKIPLGALSSSRGNHVKIDRVRSGDFVGWRRWEGSGESLWAGGILGHKPLFR
jgi:hypothetical protein